jgi:hypothetical protein
MIWGSHSGGYEEFNLLGYNALTFSGLHGVISQKNSIKIVIRHSILDNLTHLVGIAVVLSNCDEDIFGTIRAWITVQENSRMKPSNHPNEHILNIIILFPTYMFERRPLNNLKINHLGWLPLRISGWILTGKTIFMVFLSHIKIISEYNLKYATEDRFKIVPT